MTDALAPASYNVRIDGEVSGQLAVGRNIVQIGQVAAGAKVSIALPQDIAPPRRRPTPRLLRPRPFPNLLGREAEVGTASDALLGAMPVELSGESGVGKTALLRHLAHRIDAVSFPDGLVYLSGRDQPLGDLLQCLFEAFYTCQQPHKASDAELRELFKEIRALVLLDDVSLPSDQLESLLDLAPACVFLFADERPALYGERRAIALKGVSLEAALQLIQRELGRPLTDEETVAAKTLYAAVGGHPLRLLQTAARTRTDGGGLTPGEAPATPDDRSRRVLGALALVGAPLTATQAGAIAGVPDVEVVLDGLLDRKLVRVEAGRFSPVGAAPAATLSAAEEDAALDRAVAHFSDPPLTGAIDPAEIPSSSEAITRVLDAATAKHRWTDVLRVVHRVESALALAPRWGAWNRVLAKGVEAATGAGDQKELAWALHQSGTLSLGLGAAPAASAFLRRALEIRESIGDSAGAELTRHNLSLLLSPPVPTTGHGQHLPGWTPLATKLSLAAIGLAAAGWGISRLIPGPSPATIPDSLQFDALAVGSTSPMHTVAFFNRAPQALQGLRLHIDGPQGAEFAIAAEKCSAARLEPGKGCAIGLQFAPRDSSLRIATLSIASPEGRELARVFLSGRASGAPPPPSGPRLVWAPPAVTFEERLVGKVATATVSLSNRGPGQFRVRRVRVQGIQASEFSVIHENCTGRALAPSGGCTIELSFRPAAAGGRTARLTLAGDGAAAAVVLRGHGRAPPAQVAVPRVEPGRLDFGDQTVRSESPPRAVAISNSGTAPLSLASTTVTGADQASFVVARACPAQLGPGDHCTIEVRFTPRRAGNHAAALALAFAGRLSPVEVPLTGTGSAPLGPAARIDPATIDFGTRDLHTRSDPVVIRVANAGSAALQIGKISVADSGAGGHDQHNFYVKSKCSGSTIEPGANCEISVRFTPSQLGVHNAMLTILDNAPDGPHQIPLTGTAEGGVLVVSPTSLNFGSTAAGGRSDPQTVMVTNNGTRSMTVSRITVGGGGFAAVFGQGDSTQFGIVSNDCGSDLPPGRSCAVGVAFTPRKTGQVSGKLNIFSGSALGPAVQADLGGTGMAIELPAPRPLGPGDADPRRAPYVCGSTLLSWTTVPGNGVGYLLKLEKGGWTQTQQWVPQSVLIEDRTPSLDNRRDITTIVKDYGQFRWSVRARDAAGNESEPSQLLYFECHVIP